MDASHFGERDFLCQPFAKVNVCVCGDVSEIRMDESHFGERHFLSQTFAKVCVCVCRRFRGNLERVTLWRKRISLKSDLRESQTVEKIRL